MTQIDGENLSVINVSIESFLQYPNEPYGKNYQADTDASTKNLVQYRRETENKNNRSQDLFERCIDNVRSPYNVFFRAILGLGN